jgi:uncharacterized repeat protein (TIGR03803 family)
VFVFWIGAASAALAQTYTTLANFDKTNGANADHLTFVQGTNGNFFGTTTAGGTNGAGTVFEIDPGGSLTTLYNFSGGIDGNNPTGGLVLAVDGNFYGTTHYGGLYGAGTVFKIAKGSGLTTLYSFCAVTNCADGSQPVSRLVQAKDGNLYGTTDVGGVPGAGTVFKISTSGTLTTLHSFDTSDGAAPNAGLVQATDGNLYGTTAGGGAYGNGTVFKISTSGRLTTLYAFCAQPNCADGQAPFAGLVQGTDGNLYGSTTSGGDTNCGVGSAPGCGTVFKITLSGKLTTLHMFSGNDGAIPFAGLLQATDRVFYGTTTYLGPSGGGTIFKVTQAGTLTTLYSFPAPGGGTTPLGTGLLQATNGSFYGTTLSGGTNNDGTVFSLAVGLGPFVNFVQGSGIVGYAVEILGRGFTGTTAVSFNGTAATFTVQSDTYLTATVPAGATTGLVSVTTPGGALTSSQIFRVTPQILSFSPTSGPVGTNVVVTGESLTGATGAAFGGVETTNITVNSDTQITVSVPTGAKTGVIAVQTHGGNAQSTAIFTVTP